MFSRWNPYKWLKCDIFVFSETRILRIFTTPWFLHLAHFGVLWYRSDAARMKKAGGRFPRCWDIKFVMSTPLFGTFMVIIFSLNTGSLYFSSIIHSCKDTATVTATDDWNYRGAPHVTLYPVPTPKWYCDQFSVAIRRPTKFIKKRLQTNRPAIETEHIGNKLLYTIASCYYILYPCCCL